MESNKHNDDLIRRKLDAVNVEPSKLNFTKLEANYQKAKKSESRKWLMILLFAILGLGTIFSTYLLITNTSASKNLAANKTEIVNEINSGNIQTNTNNNASIDKSITVSKENESISKNLNERESFANNENKLNSIPSEIKKAQEVNGSNVSKTENSLNTTKTNNTSDKKNTTEENFNTGNKNKAELKNPSNLKENKRALNNLNKPVDNTTEDKSFKNDKETILLNKKVEYEAKQKAVAYAKTAKENNTTSPSLNSGKKTNAKEEEKSKNEMNAINNNLNKKENGIETNKPVSNNTNEKIANKDGEKKAEELGKESAKEIKSDTAIVTNVLSEKLKTDSINKEMDKKPISETKTEEAKPINAAAIPTPSNLAETIKKHQFSISTEVVYSNIIYEAKPNANAASNNTHFNSNFVQSFSDGQIGNKYKLLSGSAQLGYSYKGGFGVNIGIGFFNIENKVDAKAFTQTKNSIVLDHYVYDSLGVIKDTIYKAGPSKNFVVVNGDTVAAQDYLNNIRFITIPLSFTYKIKLSNKFSIEPHAGFQFGIPLNSYQLVALKPTEFEYSKNKLFLKSTTFFDFALKVNYKIGSNAAIYLKQGYFFNNKSIYSVDYALDYKLRNIYTSFGISIYLK